MLVRELWSGGQTGVDRAALDAGRDLGIATGGWVPRGRLAEDGAIPLSYDGLRETPTTDYGQRTSGNVRDCDATLILYRASLHGGTAYTRDEAVRLGKPHLAVDLDLPAADTVAQAADWLSRIGGARLNVAGPRESSDPGIGAQARAWLIALLSPQDPTANG